MMKCTLKRVLLSDDLKQIDVDVPGKIVKAVVYGKHGNELLLIIRPKEQPEQEHNCECQRLDGTNYLHTATYHRLLNELCDACGVPGSPTFWQAIEHIADRLKKNRPTTAEEGPSNESLALSDDGKTSCTPSPECPKCRVPMMPCNDGTHECPDCGSRRLHVGEDIIDARVAPGA